MSGQKWYIKAYDRINLTPKLGDAANITANLRIDGGVANAIDDVNPIELEGGYYVFDITQAESNGNYILICPSSTTANIQVEGCPKTFTTNSGALATVSAKVAGISATLSRPTGTVIADVGNSSSGFVTDLTESANDYWLGGWVKFTSGNLINQIRKIASYNGITRVLTFTFPFTETPAVGNAFEIIAD